MGDVGCEQRLEQVIVCHGLKFRAVRLKASSGSLSLQHQVKKLVHALFPLNRELNLGLGELVPPLSDHLLISGHLGIGRLDLLV